MDIEYRIKYYMGKSYNKQIIIKKTVTKIPNHNPFNKVLILNYNKLSSVKKRSKAYIYSSDLLRIFNLFNKKLLKNKRIKTLWGDLRGSLPQGHVIAKTRSVNDRSIILFKLNTVRHWSRFINDPLPFEQKKDAVVWRGATTGSDDRFRLVKRFHKHHPEIDVGFSHIVQGQQKYKKFVKNYLSVADQLQYKFIIAVEGNDVSTGLKWMLNTNSVVMMVKPTTSSWLMEDHLIPFVHYIPLKADYSDLKQMLQWGLDNPDKCVEISLNARNYMQKFLDKDQELQIQYEILKRYLTSQRPPNIKNNAKNNRMKRIQIMRTRAKVKARRLKNNRRLKVNRNKRIRR